MLTVTAPALQYEGVETGIATLERPVDVRVGPVSSDGAILGVEALSTFGFFVYRRSNPGAALDIWDEGEKAWTSELVSVDRAPTQLAYQPDDDAPWQGIIVAAGGRDAAGEPQFEKAVAGYPLYSVRAYFVAADGSEAFLSAPSENVTFASVSDKNLVVMGPGEGEELDAATQARVQLRDPSLQMVGGVRIDRAAPGATVTIENAAGASVVLHPDGRIEITPAVGRRVVVAGDLETEHITYLPAGSSVKQALL